ncbi:acyltransferase [Actinoplanes sp. NPDC023801]|uniref:acyltransferase family protein n=1 Tax=Actinoplanes sp. NPDC023801 TaxID=3154595 RepID=UPI0033ECF6E4
MTNTPRMAWLDALRGFAAVVVALFHLSPYVIGRDNHLRIYEHFDLGKYGVLLFFLVSGYVIPMSLERHGSLRRFWVGRLFRIYPAYLFTVAVVVLLVAAGISEPHPGVREETVGSGLGQVTMLQDFVGVSGMITPFWTLSFEMTFYLIVAGLFAWNLHRLSAWWAAGLTLAAALGGPALPDALLGGTPGRRRVLAAVLVLVVAACLCAYLSGRRLLVLAAGAAGIGFVLLPAVNGHATRWIVASASWQALLMLGVMFAGTVVHRVEHGEIRRRPAFAALTVVFLGCVLTNWLHTGQPEELVRWAGVTAAVTITFVLGFALRERRMPAALTWLGAVSFSIYLLHVVVLGLLRQAVPAETAGPILFGLLFAAGTLLASWFAHRFVEQPGQALGRRLQRRAGIVLGPEQPLRPPAATEGSDAGTRSFGKAGQSV